MNFLKTTMKLFILALLMSATSCQDKYPDLEDGLYAEIITNKGTIVVQLTYDKVPITVANFVSLAEGTNTLVDSIYKGKKYYDGLTFHRVLKDFMIQAGDPKANGSGGPGYKFKDELDPTLKHDKKGILSMANPGYDANGSQFFITHKATPWLDGYDENGNLKACQNPRTYCHSVFGEVVSGLDIVDSVEQKDVIQEINIIRKGSAAKKFDAPKIFADHFAEDARLEKEKQAKIDKAVAAQKKINDDYNTKTETLDSGLKIHYITKGTGVKPKQGQFALINYEGYFVDGSIFDSNIKEAEENQGRLNQEKIQRDMYKPVPMQVSPDAQLITGFKEALANMRVGDKVFVYVPSHLAYGERGRGQIKPNTDLTFIMEMTALQE